MKNRSYMSIRYVIVCIILSITTAAGRLQAQGTAFTYQGRLSSATTGVTGLYDFRFAAYDAMVNGNQVGNTVNLTAVGVTNGLFTVTLDFGANVFAGASRYLDLAAKANGSLAAFVSMTPRQSLTPAPYATYAKSAGSVAGSFSGDVTGTQGATVVQAVAGYSGTVLASGAAAANAAGSQNYPGTIVKRDGQGNFAAGNISGSFSGSGAGLTGIPAASITGTISGSQIGAGAVGATQLNAASPNSGQVLTYNGSGLVWNYPAGTAGANTFTNSLTVGTTAGQFTILGENGSALGISATGGLNPGHVRFRNALEVSPSADGSAPGYLDVRSTNGATIALHGDTGVINASYLTTVADVNLGGKLAVNAGSAGTLTFQGEGNAVAINATGGFNPGHIRMRNALELQPSVDHANAGYLDVRNTNGNATIAMDGGSGNITANGSVSVGGNLSANNTPGVNYSQDPGNEDISIPDNYYGASICSEGNAKPSLGFFIINAYVSGIFNGNLTELVLLDVSDSNHTVFLTSVKARFPSSLLDNDGGTLSLSWVVPITNPNGYQNFGLNVVSKGGGAHILSHNLTVLFVPRQNN